MNLHLSNQEIYKLSALKATTARVLIVLASLSYNEVVHMGALAHISNVPKATAEQAIEELLQAGILTEHENKIDYVLNGRAFCIG